MKLLLLRCPRCNHALSPDQDDQVVQCPNCRAAVAINEAGVELVNAHYAAPSGNPSHWLPFWVYLGQVTIRERKTQGGRSAEQEAQAFWVRPRRLYIPAWGIDLRQARDMISLLIQKQPSLEAIDPPAGTSFEPAVVTPADGRKLLELVIVSIEAARKDWMESLDYDLRLDSEALWLFPATRKGSEWQLLLKKF